MAVAIRGSRARWRRNACIAYVGLFVALNGLPLTPWGQWWPLQVIRALGLWLYLPTVVLGVITLLWRQRAGVWLLIPLAAFAIEYGWCLWPNGAIAPPTPIASLRVMTWNLNYRNTDAAAIAAQIAIEDPDAIALQEVSPQVKSELAARLRDRYPYQQIIPAYAPIQIAELAIFSRLPMAPAEDATTLHRIQGVRLTVGDRQLAFYNVHLPVPQIRSFQVGPMPVPTGFEPNARQAGFGQLWQHLQGIETHQAIVLGDFNSADRAANYQQLRSLLRDAFRDRGWGFGLTYPAQPKIGPLPWDPIVRIDYIFHGQGLQAITARTGEGPGSDHRYVVADLQLR